MKTLYIAYHDLKTEARSQEMIELLKLYGETTAVSYGKAFDSMDIVSICNKESKKGLVEFLRNAKKSIKSIKPDIVILHDDYPLVFVKYIRKMCPKAIIINDSSELYLVNERIHNNTFKKKIAHLFRYVELFNTKKVDIVIAANKERAEIMKNYFKLKKMPLVFENIHKIKTRYDENSCLEKFGYLFDDNKFVILYAGGVAEERLTFKITTQIGALGEKYCLIIVGAAEIGGKAKLEKLLEDKHINNTVYLGFITREELKYLIEKCDVSISAFAMDVVNNINCASGKVYEGLFLGKPLLAGENPSLKSLCEKNKIGISTNDFYAGCLEIQSNYEFYKSNVNKFIENLDYDSRVEIFKAELDREIGKIIRS